MEIQKHGDTGYAKARRHRLRKSTEIPATQKHKDTGYAPGIKGG